MTKRPDRKIALRRRLAWGAAGLAGTGALLWILVHSTTWAGPLVANGLRATVGTDNVARLEDFVYAVEDRVTQIRRRGEKPKAHWAVPAPKPKAAAVASAQLAAQGNALGTAAGAAQPQWPAFEPKAVGPVHKSWSAPGDGQWVAVDDPRHPDAPTVLYKTLVHPDPNRSWGELFVVALDLEQVDLHAVAGTHEPKAEQPLPKDFARPGKVPVTEHAVLLAAFNGGFMAEHGHYGMLVDGVTLIKPRDASCTVVGYADGSVEIATWKSLAHAAERMRWSRQTPACMYENNVMHLGLRFPETRLWGATLDGDTVIRRSAIGLDESRRILFVGIGNNMTARALAEGMHHAGAVDVAQLDVNWSYPKFLLYGAGKDGLPEARALMDGFEYNAGDYVSKSSLRDFFYVTRRNTPRGTHLPAQSTQRPSTVSEVAGAASAPGASSVASAPMLTPPVVSNASDTRARTSDRSKRGTEPGAEATGVNDRSKRGTEPGAEATGANDRSKRGTEPGAEATGVNPTGSSDRRKRRSVNAANAAETDPTHSTRAESLPHADTTAKPAPEASVVSACPNCPK
jgi:hypothetical protein